MKSIANVQLLAAKTLTASSTIPTPLIDGTDLVRINQKNEVHIDSANNAVYGGSQIKLLKYDANVVVDYDDLTGNGLPQHDDLIFDIDTQEIVVMNARTTDTTGTLVAEFQGGAVTADTCSFMDMTGLAFTASGGTITPAGVNIAVDQTAQTSTLTSIATDVAVDYTPMTIGLIGDGTGNIRVAYNTLGATVTCPALPAVTITVDETVHAGTITIAAITGAVSVDMTAVGVGNEISTVGTDISTLGTLPPLNSYILNAAGTEYHQLISRDGSGLFGALDAAFTTGDLVNDSATYCADTDILPDNGDMLVIAGVGHALLTRTDDLFGSTDVALAGANQAYGVVEQANFLPIATSIIEVDGTTDVLAVRTDDITGDMTTGFDTQVNQTANWAAAGCALPAANNWLFDPAIPATATVHELTFRTNDFRGTVAPVSSMNTPGFGAYIPDSGFAGFAAGTLIVDGGSAEVRAVTPTSDVIGVLAAAYSVDLAGSAWTSVPVDEILPPAGSIIGIDNGASYEYALLETNVDNITGTISAATTVMAPAAWEYLPVGDVNFINQAGTITTDGAGNITYNIPTGNILRFSLLKNTVEIDSRVCYAGTSVPVNMHFSGCIPAFENDYLTVTIISDVDGATVDLFDYSLTAETIED